MGSISTSQLNIEGLRDLIATALELPKQSVKKAFNMEEIDNDPFIVVSAKDSKQIGHSSTVSEHFEYISLLKEIRVSLDFFGKNSLLMAEKLNTLLYSSLFLRGLKSLKIGLVKNNPVIDLTAIAGAGIEERANLDLILSYVCRIKSYSQNIKKVELEVKN